MNLNTRVVHRRDINTGESYWCFADHTGTTYGKRHATEADANAALDRLIEKHEAELDIPCTGCKRPMREHINYECPVAA